MKPTPFPTSYPTFRLHPPGDNGVSASATGNTCNRSAYIIDPFSFFFNFIFGRLFPPTPASDGTIKIQPRLLRLRAAGSAPFRPLYRRIRRILCVSFDCQIEKRSPGQNGCGERRENECVNSRRVVWVARPFCLMS